MAVFKRKVFIVLRTTVYSNEYVKRIGLPNTEYEQVEVIFDSEKKAIGYIRGFIRGVIHKCNETLIMKENCIREVPSVEEIKQKDIRFYCSEDRDEWITYIRMDVE